MNSISAVILTFNSAQNIHRSLTNLIGALSSFTDSWLIYVIDNGSNDGTLEIVEGIGRQSSVNLELIRLPKNLGTTVSRNLALRKCKSDYVLVMDDDVYVSEGVLETLREHLRADEGIGVIGPRVNYPDGSFQKSFDNFPTIQDKIKRALFLKTIERRAKPPVGVTDVDYLISAFWLLRGEAVRNVGFFDEKIFYSPEDVDYCMRIRLAGYRVVYMPLVSVVHDAQERSRGWRLNKFTWLHLKGLAYFFWKYKYLFRVSRTCPSVAKTR